MSTEDNPLATILVAKEKASKMLMATVVPLKRWSVEFTVKRTPAFLKEIGLESSDVVLKSDQENCNNGSPECDCEQEVSSFKVGIGGGAWW